MIYALARRTVVALINIGPEKTVEVAVGTEPSNVYRIVAAALGHVIVTFCAEG